jgi:hypothetical protein
MQVSSPSTVPTDLPSSDERFSDVLDLVAAAVTITLVAVVASGRGGVPRIVLALGFAFFVPGRAIITNWPKLARWSQVSGAIVLSLVVLALVAMVSLWAHAWNPLRLLYGEAALCLVGLAARQFWRWLPRERRQQAAPVQEVTPVQEMRPVPEVTPVPEGASLVALFDAALSDARFSDVEFSDTKFSDTDVSDAANSDDTITEVFTAWSDDMEPDG